MKGEQFGYVEMVKRNVTQHLLTDNQNRIRGVLQAMENPLE
jgi:hypothetical protein